MNRKLIITIFLQACTIFICAACFFLHEKYKPTKSNESVVPTPYAEYVPFIKEDSYDKIRRTILDTNRIWDASDFGILPDKDVCYTDIMQELVGIAYTLPGITRIKLQNGSYHFKITFDCTKLRREQWVYFLNPNRGVISFYYCDNILQMVRIKGIKDSTKFGVWYNIDKIKIQ